MDRLVDGVVSVATEKQRKNHTLHMREYKKRKSKVSLDANRKNWRALKPPGQVKLFKSEKMVRIG